MKLFGIGEKILTKCSARVFSRCAAWALCFAMVYCAKAMQASGAAPQVPSVRVPAKAAHPTSIKTVDASGPKLGGEAGKTPDPISLSNANAAPAAVILKNRSLTVKAYNSDLSQILKNIADISGMTINGDAGSARVFGVYGPGKPSDVLANLLAGSGSNFMMTGDTSDGAPRELLILPQNGHPPLVNTPSPTAAAAASDDGENSDVDAAEQDQPGPGAIVNVPPAGSQDPQERTQQNLQRLEQMHEQQQKQQETPQ